MVDAGPLPTGWAGKARALQIGLETAATPIVVSVDADCRATPGFVAAMAEALAGHALVTAGARVHSPDLGERLVHASMLATLVYRLGPPGVRAPRAHRTLANGQCMVFDRHAVLEAGGFTPVAGNLVEDIALARHLAGRGLPVAFLDATGILEVEGYGSALGTLRGWGRSLALREVTSIPWMVADLAVVWAAMILPLPRLLSGRGDVVDAGGCRAPLRALALPRRGVPPPRTGARARTARRSPRGATTHRRRPASVANVAGPALLSSGGRPGRPGRNAGR